MITTRRNVFRTAAFAGIGITCLPVPVHASANGISALLAVAQQKAKNANKEALNAANNQRDLLNKQKEIRDAKKQLALLQGLARALKEIEGLVVKARLQLSESDC